ncbi:MULTISPECIES: NAD(P)-dependent oxidoreductase [unclassified Streptomyces]|uniref:NAD(P)-dependent oxidoreductase n=1 Tax=unclassified Streptomyces TaxID=2593676 RepID=UPI002033FDE9|nr:MULTISPECIES: NAD(P)-dependent oxidoreductase [unclassified Streptomyces]MCM2423346.1 NAD(P)-dependent oxidoreductase [Streptomyces sp. RKAG293]MCM2424443.1 NAD(P)-dependent oxidoreductase [Streptomyces sp. RKAG337]
MDAKELTFIGLGNMGRGMAHTLLKAGYALTVYNRTAQKAEALVAQGAWNAPTPQEAAAGQRVVLLSLSDEHAVEQILFDQVAPVLDRGSIVIDTSTVSPRYARDSAERLAELGLRRVEACVVGNPFQAHKGELRVFVSGAEEDIAEVRDVLDVISSEVIMAGDPGMASTIKLIFNLLLGAQIAALAEGVSYGVAAGLDRDLLIQSIAGSGFSSMVMRFRAELMLKGNYEPAFFRASLMEKDLRLANKAAQEAGILLPVLDMVRARFAEVIEAGDGDKDAAILIEHTRT